MKDANSSDVEWNGELFVNDEGEVEGELWKSVDDEHYVSVAVVSYSYERDGEEKMNHVPHIVVSEKDGGIVGEPHAHDSNNPDRAIHNAIVAGEGVVKHPE